MFKFLLASVLAQPDVEIKSCFDCWSSGYKYCLDKRDLSYGNCFDLNYASKSTYQTQNENNQFCSDSTFKNNILKEFTCPLKSQKCPNKESEVFIDLEEAYPKEYTREHIFNFEGPDPDAKNFFCKYVIKVPPALKDGSSYIFLQIESYGFDDDVFIIAQEAG